MFIGQYKLEIALSKSTNNLFWGDKFFFGSIILYLVYLLDFTFNEIRVINIYIAGSFEKNTVISWQKMDYVCLELACLSISAYNHAVENFLFLS